MESPPPAAQARGKRYVSALFVTIAAVFVLMSAYQIVGPVFGLGVEAPPNAPTLAAGPCAADLRKLSAAVERALTSAGRATDEDHAMTEYRAALSPEWDEEGAVAGACAAEPHGNDAYAAVARLRRAGEGVVRRQVVELGPIREDVAAYLRP